MRSKKKIWIGFLCGIAGFAFIHANSANIQAGIKDIEITTKEKKVKKKKPVATYAPVKGVTITVKSKASVKKIKNVKKEIKSIKVSLKDNNTKLKQLREHRNDAEDIIEQDETEINEDLKNYTQKYNASEYNNNIGYSMYTNLQKDYVAKQETALGTSLQSLTLSMGDNAVSDNLEDDVENTTTRIRLFKETIKQEKKELKALRNRNKKIKKYANITFNSKDIFLPSNVDKKSLKYALEGTELEPLADAFIKAEKKYGVNAIALASIAAHESAWGSSRRAREDNNLTGFGVYSNSAKGVNGKTKTANIMATAECLATRYAEPGQVYYCGTGLMGVNQRYAASRTWAYKVEECGITIMERIQTYNN